MHISPRPKSIGVYGDGLYWQRSSPGIRAGEGFILGKTLHLKTFQYSVGYFDD